MSGLDFLALVLQSSNSFNMKASFRVLFSLILTAYKGDIQLMALGSWCPIGLFLKVESDVSVVFFCLKSANCFPIKTHVFGMSFVFFYFLFIMMGFEFGSDVSVSDFVMTSQDYIKVEHVRTWLLSSSLANFQQFWSECFFFFKFCLVYFLLFTRALFNCCTQGPCVPRGCLV